MVLVTVVCSNVASLLITYLHLQQEQQLADDSEDDNDEEDGDRDEDGESRVEEDIEGDM